MKTRALAQLTDATPRRILLRRDELAPLLAAYDIHILAEAAPLVYATIKEGQTDAHALSGR